MNPKRYIVVEQDLLVYPPLFRVYGVEKLGDFGFKRVLLKSYKTFRGADKYAARLLAANLRVYTKAAA